MIEKRSEDGTLQYVVVEPGDPHEPLHNPESCTQCQYVGHQDFIRASRAEYRMAEMTLGKRLATFFYLYDPEKSIVPVGRFTLPGWTDHNMFWLFQCPGCREMSVDYLHGYRLFLKCGHCEGRLFVEGDRFYAESATPKPPSVQQQVAHIRALRRQLGR